jgi:hypothetical protein
MYHGSKLPNKKGKKGKVEKETTFLAAPSNLLSPAYYYTPFHKETDIKSSQMREEILRKNTKTSVVVFGVAVFAFILQIPILTDNDSSTVGTPLKISMAVMALLISSAFIKAIFTMLKVSIILSNQVAVS